VADVVALAAPDRHPDDILPVTVPAPYHSWWRRQKPSRRVFIIWAALELLVTATVMTFDPRIVLNGINSQLGGYSRPVLAIAFVEEALMVALVVLLVKRHRDRKAARAARTDGTAARKASPTTD